MEKAVPENGRPDKPVPCPRCQSLNTKFCYFNNYNIKQPRHFCRQCQRYWTAGGSLRNVPVGAGRRKHKISQSKSSDGSANGNSRAPSSGTVSVQSNGVLKQGLSAPSVDSSPVITINNHHSFQAVSNNSFREIKGPTNHGSGEPNVSKGARNHGCPEVKISKEHERVINPHLGAVKASNLKASESLGLTDMRRRTKPETETEIGLELKLSKDEPQLLSREKEAMHTSMYSRENSSAEKRDVYSFQRFSHKQDVMVTAHDASKKDDMLTPGPYFQRKEDMAKFGQDHDDSTCCSSVTANLPGSMSEAISPPNSTMAINPQLPASSIPGFGNPAMPWGPLMWPWLWQLMFNTSNAMLTNGMPQIDPAQLASFRAAVGAIIPQMDPAQIPSVSGMSVPNMPPVDPAFAAALTASFLQWQQAWHPYTWGLPWNFPWNTTNMNASVPNHSNKRDRSPTREEQESNGNTKYPRGECQNEPPHGSGCSGEAVDANHKLDAGFERKSIVQPYQTIQNLQQSPHQNPAAHARSLAFHEGN